MSAATPFHDTFFLFMWSHTLEVLVYWAGESPADTEPKGMPQFESSVEDWQV